MTCSFLLLLLSEIPLYPRLYLLSQARVIPAAILTLYLWKVRTKMAFYPWPFLSTGEKKCLETANLSYRHSLFELLELFCICGL